jgi:hypothetical protein
MAALTQKRPYRPFRAKTIDLPGTAGQQTYQGGIACWNTATGLVVKAAPGTTLVPIGVFVEDKLVGSGGMVTIELFRELEANWFANATAGDAVAAANLGGLVYLLDDQTVASNDNTNPRSVAGRAWKLDATKGVLVEFRQTAGDRLGGLDA